MSIEGDDGNGEPRRRKKLSARRAAIVVGVTLVVGVVIGAVIERHVTGANARLSAEEKTSAATTDISILPGPPDFTIPRDSLYEPNDPWKAYLAGEHACPGGERVSVPLVRQAETMVCLVNFARRKRGLEPVSPVKLLNRTSVLKANRIERCSDFMHNACGEDAAADVRAAGYLGEWGENLFIGEGPWGAPRPALDGWLNSAAHRDNLFRPEWRTGGVAVMKMARLGGERNVTLWVNQFGTG